MAVVAVNAGFYLFGAAWIVALIESGLVQIISTVLLAVLAFEGIIAIRELKQPIGS